MDDLDFCFSRISLVVVNPASSSYGRVRTKTYALRK